MRRLHLAPAAALLLSLGACADASPSAQRIGTGAAVGALGGAAIGSFTGNAGWGALIGAGAGAAGGYLFDQSRRREDRAFQQGYQQGRASRPPS
jgi:hypothetical protein